MYDGINIRYNIDEQPHKINFTNFSFEFTIKRILQIKQNGYIKHKIYLLHLGYL